jgi:hypothetical protein
MTITTKPLDPREMENQLSDATAVAELTSSGKIGGFFGLCGCSHG